MITLNPLPSESIPAALERAEGCRLSRDWFAAESICRDILLAEPGNERALELLILVLCDELASGTRATAAQARLALAGLPTADARAYYAGMICERQAAAVLARATPGAAAAALDLIEEAMSAYERALALGRDSLAARLRWNCCARMITDHQLERQAEDPVEVMLE